MVIRTLITFFHRQEASEAFAVFAKVLEDCDKTEIAAKFKHYSKDIKEASLRDVAKIIRAIRQVYRCGYGGPLDFFPGTDTPENRLLSERFIAAEEVVSRYV
ncbi:hypothetical protein KRX54_00070 [Actinomycetaceae bacterium TAE3-ERU4]|nr:hypothetical protein [Actinomycetaceae bacterium TAE3-ERU4]